MTELLLSIEKLMEYSYSLPFLGTVPMGKFLIAVAIFLGLNLCFWLLQQIILVQLRSFSAKTNTRFDDTVIAAVEGIRGWVYSIVSIYAALHIFTLPTWLETVSLGVFLFAVVWQVIEIAVIVIDYLASLYVRKSSDGDVTDANAETMADLIRIIARAVLWVLGGLFVLANLGVNVTSLIAGLGIGGIAVAFALQGVLSDLFASFSIYFDKPFRIGDVVTIGNDTGTVEKIGIKSTRIKTLRGEELILSNTELTTARVQNLERMQERRIAGQIGITYETGRELVEAVPGIIKDVLDGIENVRFDRVHFTAFGDSALLFDFVYFIESADMVTYLDAQHEFNYRLLRAFADKGIEFAYPTQTIYSK